MSPLTFSPQAAPPRNLCELLLRDVACLLVTSQLISRSAQALRPKCGFSSELSGTLDTIVATSCAGEILLQQPLADSGAVLPDTADLAERLLLTDYFTRLPAQTAPGLLAAELAVNLRLLAQHIELRIRLVAEEALLVGQNALCHSLMIWAAEWRSCGQALRAATVRARAQAYVADLPEFATPQAG